MTGPDWSQADRERSYTALCEAVTNAGQAGEAAFLARLALLLMEEVGDAAVFARLLAEAAQPGRSAPVAETTVN